MLLHAAAVVVAAMQLQPAAVVTAAAEILPAAVVVAVVTLHLPVAAAVDLHAAAVLQLQAVVALAKCGFQTWFSRKWNTLATKTRAPKNLTRTT